MRMEILIVSLFILMAPFTIISSCSIDSAGKSVDELIDESNGIFAPTGLPENPQEARTIWSRDYGINFTKPGNRSSNSPGAGETSTLAETDDSIKYQSSGATDAAQGSAPSAPATAPGLGEVVTSSGGQTASEQNAVDSPSTNFAGEWTLELRDSKTRQLGLTLVQSEDAIYGDGSMNDGTSTLPVLVSGYVQGEKLRLDVISSEQISLYRLTLTASGGTLSGDYRAFSNGRQPWTGIVRGIRNQS